MRLKRTEKVGGIGGFEPGLQGGERIISEQINQEGVVTAKVRGGKKQHQMAGTLIRQEGGQHKQK